MHLAPLAPWRRCPPLLVAILLAAPAAAVVRPPAGAPAGLPTSFRSDALVVRLRDGEAPRAAAAAIAAEALAGLKPSRVTPVFAAAPADAAALAVQPRGVFRLTFDAPIDAPAAARALARDPRVQWAEPVYRAELALVTNDPYLTSSGAWGQPYGDLWGLSAINATSAWSTTNGSGVLVAVVDTGSDPNHPDLAMNLFQAADPPNGIDDDGNGFIDDAWGWDFANGDNNPTDDYGHGTHVAGTIAAVGNNATGIVGVAWGARILSVKGFDASGMGDSDELAAGIVYATNRGAKVINMSWGLIGFSQVVEDALQAAHAAGVTLVAAAGNNAGDAGAFHPCSSRWVICVGAETPTHERASFSNYGSALDLLAPGGSNDAFAPSILSLLAAGIPPQPTALGDRYLRLHGTSMASPHAAGVAALLRAAVPTIDGERARQALRRGAGASYAAGWDTDSGYGRLAAAAAIADAQGGVGSARLLNRPDELRTGGLVRGIATAPGFASWELAVGAGTIPTSWTVVQTSTAAVANGTLTTWDPGLLGDGPYVLRLTVRTAGGRAYEDRLGITLDRVAIRTPAPDSTFRAGDLVNIGGSAGLPDVTSFEVQFADPTDPQGFIWRSDGMTLANGGVGPVTNGPLATWNTAGLTRAAHYFLRLIVHRSGGPDEVTPELHSIIVDPTLHPGWPRVLPVEPEYQILNVDRNATVADLDGDGLPEMVIAQGRSLHAYRHDGSEAPGFPRTLPEDFVVERAPAVGDLDGDGAPEIVMTTSPNGWRALVFEHDGVLRAVSHPSNFPGRYVALGDVTGDAKKEIVGTGDFIGEVTILDQSAVSIPVFRCQLPAPPGATDPPQTMPSPPALADLDGDGKDEIVVLQRTGRLQVHACRADGSELPGFPVDLGPSSYAWTMTAPAIGDLDGDGSLEIVVGSNECRLWVLDRFGHVRPGWPWQPATTVYWCSAPALADIEGNRTLEVVAGGMAETSPGSGSYYATMWALGSGGQPLAGWPVLGGIGAEAGSPVIADIDGDGRREVVFDGDLFGTIFNSTWRPYGVRAAKADGGPVAGFPRPTIVSVPNGLVNSPAIADFDGDGLLELFWVSGKVVDADGTFLARLYLWDLPAPVNRSRTDWPMSRHDAAHTGAQLRNGCTPGSCGASLPFEDGFEAGLTAWRVSP